MPLNTAQYVAPLNSQGVLTGLVQGVKQGPGVSILPDGTITLDASTAVGFVTTNNPNAAQYVWPSAPGATAPGQMLADDGSGNLYWSSDFVQVFPTGGSFSQQGAAAIPAGPIGSRPSPAPAGFFRFNTSVGSLEFSNGTSWFPVSPPTGGVFSFYQAGVPTANATGDFWYDTTVSTEKVWSGTSWVPVTPFASTSLPGRVQVGTNIQVSPTGVISVGQTLGVPGGVSNVGVTTLTDNLTSTLIDSALTANQGRILQDQITALAGSSNLTLAGLISGTGVLTYVTPEGTSAGFAVGSPLPSASAGNEGFFVMVEDPGGFSPPGGFFTVVTRGDWFESTGASWQFLNVGYDPPIASTTQFGITRLATDAETQAGTSSSIAVTPAGVASIFNSGAIDATKILLLPPINGNTNVQAALNDAVYDITSAGNTVSLTITATGKYNLEVTQATESQRGGAEIATNAETQALTSDSVIVTPLKLGNLFSSGSLDANDILLSPLINGNTTVQAALGNAVYNVASSDNSITVAETPVGQVDLVVTQATAAQIGGAEIATQLETETGTDDSRIVTPLKLRTAAVYKSDFEAKGDILSAQGNDQPLILPVGTNDQYLVADSTTATGLKWYTLPSTVGVLGNVSNSGITTITDNVTSTSIDSALSARMGKLLQEQINALVVTSNLTFAGTLNSLGVLTFVTTEGASAGFTVGSTLPVAAAGNAEYFVICEQAGTITPPGGAATTVTQGDWFVSTGAAWQFLNVGFDVPLASTTQAGIVRLATNAETQTGTDATIAVTPAGLTSRAASETLTGIAELATQAETETGTDDTRIVTPLKLRTTAVYKSDFNAKGDLLSADGNDSPVILGVGTNGQVLTADSATPSGLTWSTPSVPGFYNLDDIAAQFDGVNKIFTLSIGGVNYAPNPVSNIMVFLGGVAQIPGIGESYTVAGSTITFDSPPEAGTRFYATTVR